MSCGSLLTIQDGVVYFVHQSAKDFLLTQGSLEISPTEVQDQHFNISVRCIRAMETRLKHNIYDLDSPGCLIQDISRPSPDPLLPMEYCCTHWVDHISISGLKAMAKTRHLVLSFLNDKLLFWIEAMILLRALEGVNFGIHELELPIVSTPMPATNFLLLTG